MKRIICFRDPAVWYFKEAGEQLAVVAGMAILLVLSPIIIAVKYISQNEKYH